MNIDFIHRIGLMVFFISVQVLILNHIHLFNVATPLVYVYFILLFPRNQQRWVSILLAFFLGLILDSFSNTPGEPRERHPLPLHLRLSYSLISSDYTLRGTTPTTPLRAWQRWAL